MHSRFSYLTIAFWAIASAAVLAFLGCEWGGVHDNTWNDGYSWANFTGTYRFVNAVYFQEYEVSDGGSDTSAKLKSVADFAKAAYPVLNGALNAEMNSATTAGGTLPNDNGVILNSVTIKVGTVTLTSNKEGILSGTYGASGTVGSGGTCP